MFANTEINIFIAFFSGVLFFLSPCVLPLIPSYITYIAGVSLKDLTRTNKKRIQKQTLIHSLFFVLGLSCIYILLGASASFVGQLFFQYKDWVRIIGGVFIIIFGVMISGLLKIPFLEVDYKFKMKSRPLGYFGSFVIGLVFAAGWTPCVGPLLGSILFLASTSDKVIEGVIMLAVFSLGFAIPFVISSLAINQFLLTYGKFKRNLKYFYAFSGIFLIVVGLLLVTNHFFVIANFLNQNLGFLNIEIK